MKKLKTGVKLWLSTDDAEGIFGDGKFRILKAIEAEGSLRAACEKLGISYRKAWGDLQKAEKNLDVTLVHKHRGGKSGGHAGLTADGAAWLKAYEKFQADINKAIDKAYEKNISKLVK